MLQEDVLGALLEGSQSHHVGNLINLEGLRLVEAIGHWCPIVIGYETQVWS